MNFLTATKHLKRSELDCRVAGDVSALNLDVKKDWSLVCERGSLIDRRSGCAVFGTAECFERGSV